TATPPLSLHDALPIFNAAGGIKSMGGAKLEALLGDNQAKPEVGVSVVEQMNEAGASAYIGCFSSAVALPATQAAAKYNTPFIIRSEEHTSELQSPCNL